MKKNYLTNKKIEHAEVKNISFDKSVDVAVIGLGTAGSIALITAAKKGLKTLGVEKTNYMGGVGTGGGIHIYYLGTRGGEQDLIDEKVDELSKIYSDKEVLGFHPEAKKLILEEEALENGAEINYESTVTAVYLEDNSVIGFELHTSNGLVNVRSNFVIDASGDADFCTLAGATIQFGRDYDHMPQPYSAPRAFVRNGKLSGANFDAGYVDTRDAESISNAIMHAHSLHLPDEFDQEMKFLYLNPLLGIREGRFVEGDKKVTLESLLTNQTFDHPVFELSAHHDNHSRDWAFESDLAQDWVAACGLWRRAITGQMPMEALIPAKINGLLVAGRCASMDHDASQTFRMQRDMQKTGEVAALMANIAIQSKCEIRKIDYNQLKEELMLSGCYPETFKFKCETISDLEEIKSELNSEKPNWGLWSAYQFDDSIDSHLIQWLNSDQILLSKHSAIALALRGKKKGVSILLNMIESKDAGEYKETPYAKPYYAIATYLLSKLNHRPAIQAIKDLLLSANKEDFEKISFPMVALKRFAMNCPEEKANLFAFLKEVLSDRFKDIPLQLQNSTKHAQKINALDRKPVFEKLLIA